MRTLVIIPTYNEADNIENLIEEVEKKIKNKDCSILVVDDSSEDGTIEKVVELKRKHENIIILKRAGKLGLATAYIDGMNFGTSKGFDSFIQMDADFSHNPDYLPTMLDKLEHHDLVIASRNIEGGSVKGWGALRNVISKGGSLYSRFILKVPIYDLTGGFNGWKLDLINKIGLDKIISRGYSFQIEMKYRAYKQGANICEFPILFEDRKKGKSKMSKAIFFEALLNIIKLKFIVR